MVKVENKCSRPVVMRIDTKDTLTTVFSWRWDNEHTKSRSAMWVAVSELPKSVSHPFYEKLNRLLAEHGFDEFVEAQCRSFYAEKMGRPSLAPGQYFRLLLLGYFEGLDSEREMAWRAADSSGVRSFLGLGLTKRRRIIRRYRGRDD